MSVVNGGIVVRVRRRTTDRPRLLIEMTRARDELLTRARRTRGRAGEEKTLEAAAARGKAVGYREAADLIAAAIDRASAP